MVQTSNAAEHAAPPCITVACSGGRDSMALLHATLHAAARAGLPVAALHVHHGLQPDADAWLQHVEQQCARWARQGLPVRFDHRRLDGRPSPGESVEAWARKARYRALADMARSAGAAVVLLAHHRGDQAETFLLQALRSAGVAGQAAMPRIAVREGITWVRPWLDQPRSRIEAYVRAHRLKYVDDGSNTDSRFARNRLRLTVWPALLEAFPDAEAALSAAALKAQQAQEALNELAELDLQAIEQDGSLNLQGWLRLSAARRSNALRAWLIKAIGRSPAATLIDRLTAEWPASKGHARWPAGPGELRSYRGALTFTPAAASAPATSPRQVLTIRRAGRTELPGWNGTLIAERVTQGGIALARLRECELRPRSGGERFQLAPRGIARSLKKQYQAASVPAWGREGPLLYCDGELAFAPGLGIDARCRAEPGEPQVALRWIRDGD